jgi:hypothetical protein
MAAVRPILGASLSLVFALPLAAQQYSAEMLSGLHWRDVGPMRAGRTYGVAGNAAQPDTFYMGSVGGGVWKTENAGRTWFPIADDPVTGIPIGSIGAIAVAPSDPNIVYVGTANPTFVASTLMVSDCSSRPMRARLGITSDSPTLAKSGRSSSTPLTQTASTSPPSAMSTKPILSAACIARSTAARHERRCLPAKDPENVGAVDLALDPQHPKTIYASLWATRRPPWSVYAPSNMPG